MTDELLPCPFCGCAGEYETTTEPDGVLICVRCRDCDFLMMNGPIGFGWHATKADAAASWNRRHPPAVPVAKLEALQRYELPYSGLGDGACGSGNDEITACAEGSLVRWPDLAALIAKYPA